MGCKRRSHTVQPLAGGLTLGAVRAFSVMHHIFHFKRLSVVHPSSSQHQKVRSCLQSFTAVFSQLFPLADIIKKE